MNRAKNEPEVCNQCGAPQSMMIGDEDEPIARFCAEHAAKFKRANKWRRADVLTVLEDWNRARRRGERVDAVVADIRRRRAPTRQAKAAVNALGPGTTGEGGGGT